MSIPFLQIDYLNQPLDRDFAYLVPLLKVRDVGQSHKTYWRKLTF